MSRVENKACFNIIVCWKCMGFGYINYTLRTKGIIKFNKNINIKLIHKDGPINIYRWQVDCDNCYKGTNLPIPLSEFYEKDIGIEYLY